MTRHSIQLKAVELHQKLAVSVSLWQVEAGSRIFFKRNIFSLHSQPEAAERLNSEGCLFHYEHSTSDTEEGLPTIMCWKHGQDPALEDMPGNTSHVASPSNLMGQKVMARVGVLLKVLLWRSHSSLKKYTRRGQL